MEYKDQIGRTLNLKSVPTRIVSLVPSQTELLVDLGLRQNIVGITKFCVHPKDLRINCAVVGGTKNVHLDQIAKLNPNFILCNKEENTFEMVTALEKIAPVWVSDVNNIGDTSEMILRLGEIFKVETIASQLIREIEMEKENFLKFMENKPRRTVAYLIWKNPYMAAGKLTFINNLLELNKFKNVLVSDESRYPEIAPNDLKIVDLVLLSTEPYPFKEEDAILLKSETGVEVRVVDGEYFSWYGSRLAKAFEYFKSLH